MTPPPSPAPDTQPPGAVPLPPPPGPARAGRPLLPSFPADPGRVWLVGAHGGAGCTTIVF